LENGSVVKDSAVIMLNSMLNITSVLLSFWGIIAVYFLSSINSRIDRLETERTPIQIELNKLKLSIDKVAKIAHETGHLKGTGLDEKEIEKSQVSVYKKRIKKIDTTINKLNGKMRASVFLMIGLIVLFSISILLFLFRIS